MSKRTSNLSNATDKATLHAAYLQVKAAVAASCSGGEAERAIEALSLCSLKFLNASCTLVALRSLVPNKGYTAYQLTGGNGALSRPANRAFWVADPAELTCLWQAHRGGTMNAVDFGRWSYTVALAPCLAMEMFDRGNKKGPATYFECFIGHLFARQLNVDPKKKASLPLAGASKTVRLTMDFIFELPPPSPNVHLAVKMSTRERIVQAWAHQKLLDAAYGDGKYLGAMVLFTETKLDLSKREVVEICVPDQWLAYQSLLAKMDVIYYFDPPARYQALTQEYPSIISIKQFQAFFDERARFFPPVRKS